MRRDFLEFNSVSFSYDSSATPLFKDLALSFGVGWTGVVGANGSGKSTLLRLAAGELVPTRGQVTRPGQVIYCAQRTDAAPDTLRALLEDSAAETYGLRGRLGLGEDWLARWDSLSHGERKRAQIGCALWQAPVVLALDEPTNHIDADARAMLSGALHQFRGIGLLVSHDRQLLDELCSQSLLLEPNKATMRPGGYSKGTQLAECEKQAAQAARTEAKRELLRLKQAADQRAHEAARADSLRSKRHLDRKDINAKRDLDVARLSGKDAVAGKLLRQLEGRLNQAQQQLETLRVTKEYRLGIEFRGERSTRNALFELAAGYLPLGARAQLEFPDLCMRPADRIAITGPNGAGKSTLVRHILSTLAVPSDKVVTVPQEIGLSDAQEIVANVCQLPKAQLGTALTYVSRLGTRPERLMESDEPSPGELRKLLLALGISRQPQLIVMDEPTNHLDLPSIECLEEALAECVCALLLVSHDLRFLKRLTTTRWGISSELQNDGRRVCRLCPGQLH